MRDMDYKHDFKNFDKEINNLSSLEEVKIGDSVNLIIGKNSDEGFMDVLKKDFPHLNLKLLHKQGEDKNRDYIRVSGYRDTEELEVIGDLGDKYNVHIFFDQEEGEVTEDEDVKKEMASNLYGDLRELYSLLPRALKELEETQSGKENDLKYTNEVVEKLKHGRQNSDATNYFFG
jgi:hypothetical protein